MRNKKKSTREAFRMTLRPLTWLTHLPLAGLPLLAATVLQARFLPPDDLYWRGFLFIPAQHWVWILVAAGLGIWVGWHTALPADAGPTAAQAPEQP
jgi:hypothetical protein